MQRRGQQEGQGELGLTLKKREIRNILYVFIFTPVEIKSALGRKSAGTEQRTAPADCILQFSGVGIVPFSHPDKVLLSK